MKIYTSYFAKLAKLKMEDIEPISIALSQPSFFKGNSIGYLAPKGYMLSKSMSQEEYIRLYGLILEKVDIVALKRILMQMGGGRDVALLCWEKPGDFCHRHLFAEWFEKRTGIKVVEYGSYEPEPPKPPQPIQGSLF